MAKSRLREGIMRKGNESWFWHANDMVVTGDMNPVVRVLWAALIVGIGVATMATLWIVTR